MGLCAVIGRAALRARHDQHGLRGGAVRGTGQSAWGAACGAKAAARDRGERRGILREVRAS